MPNGLYFDNLPVNRKYLAFSQMTNKIAKILLILGSILWFGGRNAGASMEQTTDEFFEKNVRPVFALKCQMCHNAKAPKAGLDLSSAEGFEKGGDNGPIVNREKLEESKLLKVIGYDDKLRMPPMGKLKDEEIGLITQWVKDGARWPATKSATSDPAPARPSSSASFSEEERRFWAFQPITQPEPPRSENSTWVKSSIDQFVLARLQSKGLQPAAPADKLTLLRRATFDLTGLPPTESEIKQFLADSSSNAFERVIERLLASPRYGEKWGRHWLDVARYADSSGNDEDHRYPHAWRYRDYVIDAFNSDLPYDQFVREQIAGDLLPAGSEDGTAVNRRGIVATGFLALGPKALAQQDKTKMLYDVYDEQVDVTSKAFLGLTVSCARCHDHKFDPIRTRDYYSMVSVFANTRSFKGPNDFVSVPLTSPLVSRLEYERYLTLRRFFDDQMKRKQYEIDEIIDRVKVPKAKADSAKLAQIMLASRRVYAAGSDLKGEAKQVGLSEAALAKWVEYLKPGKPREHLLEWENAPDADLSRIAGEYQARFVGRLQEWEKKTAEWRKKYDDAIMQEKSPLPGKPEFEAGKDRFFAQVYFGKEGPLQVTEKDETAFSAPDAAKIRQLKAERDVLKTKAPKEPDMACAVTEGDPVSQKVFVRGDYHNPGEDVPKAMPAILTISAPAPEMKDGSGRRALADWIASPGNPLTARVMVNRVWSWHFGEGLVPTPDNFGKMGERPANAELLDYLAHQFVTNKWSIKSLHRVIMNSSVYQMGSLASRESTERDNENRLLSHFNRRRLNVEEMRDALLAIDGTLDSTMGGTLQMGTGTDGENDNKRLSLKPESSKRRSVYLPLRRANLPALLNLFDFGDATTVNGKRQLTNVPTQALFWLNSEFVTERSQNLAKALISRPGTPEPVTVRNAYLKILNRPATTAEITDAQKYLQAHRAKFPGAKSRLNAMTSLVRVVMASNEFIYVD